MYSSEGVFKIVITILIISPGDIRETNSVLELILERLVWKACSERGPLASALREVHHAKSPLEHSRQRKPLIKTTVSVPETTCMAAIRQRPKIRAER